MPFSVDAWRFNRVSLTWADFGSSISQDLTDLTWDLVEPQFKSKGRSTKGTASLKAYIWLHFRFKNYALYCVDCWSVLVMLNKKYVNVTAYLILSSNININIFNNAPCICSLVISFISKQNWYCNWNIPNWIKSKPCESESNRLGKSVSIPSPTTMW